MALCLLWRYAYRGDAYRGQVRAWRLDGVGSSSPFVFRLRVLHEPGPGSPPSQAGIMCVAMPPPDVHGHVRAPGDPAAALSSGTPSQPTWAEPTWAVCGGMDGCARVLTIANRGEQQTLRLASRPDVGWMMAATIAYGAAGNALLLAGSAS